MGICCLGGDGMHAGRLDTVHRVELGTLMELTAICLQVMWYSMGECKQLPSIISCHYQTVTYGAPYTNVCTLHHLRSTKSHLAKVALSA